MSTFGICPVLNTAPGYVRYLLHIVGDFLNSTWLTERSLATCHINMLNSRSRLHRTCRINCIFSISCLSVIQYGENCGLASCPWGRVTANRVDLLTEIYTIYMETHISHRAFHLHAKNQAPRSIACGRRSCDTRKES